MKEDLVIGAKSSKKERAQGKMWTILNVRCHCCFMDSGGSNGFLSMMRTMLEAPFVNHFILFELLFILYFILSLEKDHAIHKGDIIYLIFVWYLPSHVTHIANKAETSKDCHVPTQTRTGKVRWDYGPPTDHFTKLLVWTQTLLLFQTVSKCSIRMISLFLKYIYIARVSLNIPYYFIA